jgi:hypothetical protein
VSLLAGCSGQSQFLTGGPTVGQLKTSLSHLEYENDQLKRSMAKLQQENRSMEDRLVQEQIDNGELTARLDDARNLLRDHDLEPDIRVGSRRLRDGSDGAYDDKGRASGRTLPTGRAARGRRKAPFAQISGPVSVLPPVEDDNDGGAASREGRDATTNRPRRRFDDDLDHHSFHNGPLRWLPIAGRTGDPTTQIR